MEVVHSFQAPLGAPRYVRFGSGPAVELHVTDAHFNAFAGQGKGKIGRLNLARR